MTSIFEQAAEPFAGRVAQITRSGVAAIVPCPPGPPKRIDGYTVGVIPNLDGPAPHRGEVHPDGDELLYLVSGAIEVVLDDGDEHSIGAETTVVLGEGDDTIAAIAEANRDVVVVTADRGLAERVRATNAEVVGPTWLLDQLVD